MAMREMTTAAEAPREPVLSPRDRTSELLFGVLIATSFVGAVLSRVIALVMLFIGGLAFGRHSGYGGWKAGFGIAALGTVLVVAINALAG